MHSHSHHGASKGCPGHGCKDRDSGAAAPHRTPCSPWVRLDSQAGCGRGESPPPGDTNTAHSLPDTELGHSTKSLSPLHGLLLSWSTKGACVEQPSSVGFHRHAPASTISPWTQETKHLIPVPTCTWFHQLLLNHSRYLNANSNLD